MSSLEVYKKISRALKACKEARVHALLLEYPDVDIVSAYDEQLAHKVEEKKTFEKTSLLSVALDYDCSAHTFKLLLDRTVALQGQAWKPPRLIMQRIIRRMISRQLGEHDQRIPQDVAAGLACLRHVLELPRGPDAFTEVPGGCTVSTLYELLYVLNEACARGALDTLLDFFVWVHQERALVDLNALLPIRTTLPKLDIPYGKE